MDGGNANTTISYPGGDWKMLWDNGGLSNFQLDIVGFLAVLGEGSVLANSQVSALSPLFYLPRILPAPQALLPPNRPVKLPSTPASVTAVHSGNTKDYVHHVAWILLGDELPRFTVRCVEVKKQPQKPGRARNLSGSRSLLDKFLSWFSLRSGTQSTVERPVTANTTGPLSLVTLLGFLLSVTIFIASIVFGDGMSMTATILLSFLSTLTGIANKWELKLPSRPGNDKTPAGDTVIRYPNGSYLVVKCDETIARELFFAPEEIQYKVSDPVVYRIISLFGTVILMLGIICLANAKLQLQFAWAGAYIIINAAHWIAAAVPPKMHWDLSCYELNEQVVEGGPGSTSFTEALWKAIVLTKDVRWVRNGKAAPQTAVWDEWLTYAGESAGHAGFIDKQKLEGTIFPDGKPTTIGRFWLRPKGWDPKAEWVKLSQEADAAKAKGAMRPTEAA